MKRSEIDWTDARAVVDRFMISLLWFAMLCKDHCAGEDGSREIPPELTSIDSLVRLTFDKFSSCRVAGLVRYSFSKTLALLVPLIKNMIERKMA